MPSANETTVNNTEKLRAWLRTCPTIASGKYFGADYIGENATEYALISTPSTLRYRENILGDRIMLTRQEQTFVFAARVPYGSDVQQNLDNLKFNIENIRKLQESLNIEVTTANKNELLRLKDKAKTLKELIHA